MSEQPWTIERISEALGSPMLTSRFLGEINRAPAPQLLSVFAKWQGIAQRTLDAVQRGREAATIEAAGGTVPGSWADITDEVLQAAARNRARGAA